MKPQPKWIAAFFAVLLALCGIYQTAWAQTPPAEPSHIRTYVAAEGANNIVLRLKLQNQVYGVYGALTRPVEGSSAIFAISGIFYPDTGKLRARMAVPPALQPSSQSATVDGTYDAAKDTFSLTFTYLVDGTPTTSAVVNNVARYTETLPYMVGIWQWSASVYSGEFYIFTQSPKDGTFKGLFSGSKPEDVGTIIGQASGTSGVVFKRSGTVNGQAFEQIWFGNLVDNGQAIQGEIEQTIPSPWNGTFVARW